MTDEVDEVIRPFPKSYHRLYTFGQVMLGLTLVITVAGAAGLVAMQWNLIPLFAQFISFFAWRGIAARHMRDNERRLVDYRRGLLANAAPGSGRPI